MQPPSIRQEEGDHYPANNPSEEEDSVSPQIVLHQPPSSRQIIVTTSTAWSVPCDYLDSIVISVILLL